MRVSSEDGESPLVTISCDPDMEGNILIYMDDDLCYNRHIEYDEIYLSDLNRKFKMGKYYVRVMYNDTENVTLVKSRMITLDYYLDIDVYGLKVGRDAECQIFLPEDATGDLYVTLNGQTTKVNYKDGSASCTLSTNSLQMGKYYNVSAELRNDPLYPTKSIEYELEATPNLLTPSYLASVGEKQVVLLDLPSGYSGTLKVYAASLNEDADYVIGDLISSANVVNGKAKVDLPVLNAEGEASFMAEYLNGDYTYSEGFSINAENNKDGVSVSVTPNPIEVGKSVVVKISGPIDCRFEVYVDNVQVEDMVLKNNEASRTITFATAGEHFIKVCYEDEGEGNDIFYSNTFKVTVKEKSAPQPKPVISLTLKKVKVKRSAKKLVLTATLKINKKAVKGAKLTFKFNGKKFTGKTNKKGVAKVTVKKKFLKKLKKGKKVKYQVSYKGVTKKYTVKVKK